MNSTAGAGFVYVIETIKGGRVIDQITAHNVMPTEGANAILQAALLGGTQVPTWYIGLYEGNYTPSIGDTAALLPGLATECTTYDGTTRKSWVPGAATGGAASNAAAKAEFTFTANKTVYGGFMTSAPARGATVGALVSVVRFPSPRVLDIDSILRVTAGIVLTPT
ncbi:MAG TPA: hypothetical protein PK861_00080 [Thermomonas sp.]|jgi:hypothetical protein|nr:hypothetical protein [Thermomonas sp.]